LIRDHTGWVVGRRCYHCEREWALEPVEANLLEMYGEGALAGEDAF